ncbi:bark storage protein A-like [Magnolia sinica]|uniref:bark storage protein A-like n=1 Tax=Magnolia sinica TaxID=86752 RepID=UPI00265823F2|nr:bark storage protein A-like [Magnolia sinica]
MSGLWAILVVFLAFMVLSVQETNGAVPRKLQREINLINSNGPYVGLVIPNTFEMNPLLQSPSYIPNEIMSYIDFSGRRFRFGTIEGKKVILVMTGLGMINAGITTQLLLSLFNIEGVVHYGIAGNANPSLNIGDVAIPKYWSHTALWNWQRYGDGPENELALEVNGDYTREFGYLKFSDYTTVNETKTRRLFENLLNNVWYQPEEVFPVDGTPESREHAFWVSVDKHYYAISKKLKGLKLESCINSTTCLSNTPKVVTVLRGASANIYLDNAAYRSFIYNKFHVSPVDMESASVALICLQQRVPYIAFRALSDLAGGGSADSNEAATFTSLAATNSVTVVIEFIKELFVSPVTSVM